jgi:hypothetical protein
MCATVSLAACGPKSNHTRESFADTNSVCVIMAESLQENGLYFVGPERERAMKTRSNGIACRRFKSVGTNDIFIRFRIHSSFKSTGLTTARVTVEYCDAAFGAFDIEYDGREADSPDRSPKGMPTLIVYQHGEYTPAGQQTFLEKTLKWRSAEFTLKNVRFENSQQSNADFLLRINASEFLLRSVSLRANT